MRRVRRKHFVWRGRVAWRCVIGWRREFYTRCVSKDVIVLIDHCDFSMEIFQQDIFDESRETNNASCLNDAFGM